MKETPDNHWSLHGPHMMILVPDTKALAGISTDPKNGGPYVMWAGTPYAHIMAPTADDEALVRVLGSSGSQVRGFSGCSGSKVADPARVGGRT